MSSAPQDGPITAPLKPRRHPIRAVVGILVIGLLVDLLWNIAANPGFQWDVVGRYFTSRTILLGLWATIWLTALTIVLGFVLGTLLAVARLSKNPVLQAVSFLYVWFFRSVPLLVLILFTFNVAYLLPEIRLGLPLLPPFWVGDTNDLITPVGAAILALTLHESAYAAEIVRGGILSVDQGQFEAASALGISRRRQMTRIVIPQAMRSILPAFGNQLIGLLKGTSMVSVIAVGDLLYSAQAVYNRTFQVVPLLMVATLWYVVVTTVLAVVQYFVERHFSRGATRNSAAPMRARLTGAWRAVFPASATRPAPAGATETDPET
ncbi:amino acid ABC transporter permease [Pseudooceanicola sp. 200-1SW]|uniref:amino acid ABC transporter permease n=1 Tax=Pseudooceanicola sp. 200-1SW TaxID=3425949 RepID=UPI003D7FA609